MREEEVSVCFATDAPGADVSDDKSELRIVLQPPLAIDPMARPTVELASLRFVNAYYNVSAALGNNVVHALWAFPAVNTSAEALAAVTSGGFAYPTAAAVALTIPDGTYSIAQLETALNLALTTRTDWQSNNPRPLQLIYNTVTHRVRVQLNVAATRPQMQFWLGEPVVYPEDGRFYELLGFSRTGSFNPVSGIQIAHPRAGFGLPTSADTVGFTAPNPPQIDVVNGIRVELDVASGSYAPPEAATRGSSRGHSDAIAFIPIEAAPGHQQVYRPPDAPQAGVHVGHTERMTIKLKDQAGRPLANGDHWSGMLVFRGLTPHAR
jgi:hypothetical protein